MGGRDTEADHVPMLPNPGFKEINDVCGEMLKQRLAHICHSIRLGKPLFSKGSAAR